MLHPPRNSHTAPLTTTISITYDEPISAATATSRTFAVYAMQSGLLTATHTVADAGSRIIVTPTRPFHQGELVYVIATTGTLNISGTEPLSSTQWQFRAGRVVSRCVGGFTDVGAELAGVHNSSAAWGLATAESMGATVPAFVRTELDHAIDYIQCSNPGADYGGSGYSSPCSYVNEYKTGFLILQMGFYGDDPGVQRFQDGLDYVDRHWRDGNNNPGWGYDSNPSGYLAMFALAKGLRYNGISLLDTDGDGSRDDDWYNQELSASPPQDFASDLVAEQLVGGDWNGACYPGSSDLCTTWAVLTLLRAAPPPPAQVTIEKTVNPETDVTWHGSVTCEIVLENHMATSDTNALMTDTLPSEVDFGAWIEQPTGASESGDEITWTGTVTNNDKITFTFTALHTGNYCDVVGNTAEYSGTEVISDTTTFVVVCPDLEIDKTVDPTIEVNPGGPVTYTIAFSNTGTANATSVVITDSVPVSVTSPGWSWWCSGAGTVGPPSDTYVWNVPAMATGERCVITITGDLSDTLVGPSTFGNVADIASTDVVEILTGNNSSSADVTVNTAPVADAGSSQYVGQGGTATLDGSASTDPDGHTPLTYKWVQTGSDPSGPTGTFNDDTLQQPQFTAPTGWSGILTLTLTVTDSLGLGSLTGDTVNVTAQNEPVAGLAVVNSSPTLLGKLTFFTATITAGGNVTYTWNFGDGNIGYSDDVGHVSYISHTYSTCGLTETNFLVVVTATNAYDAEGYKVYTDTTTTLVTITNDHPVAVAGVAPPVDRYQQAVVGSLVTLDGSDSYDPNSPYNDIVEYGWTQAGIVTVTLSDNSAISPTFTAPNPPTMPTVLTFTLTVTDTGCLTDSDFITIVPPVGGHTAPVGPLALLQPWLLLAALVATGAIATLALKRRAA